MIIILIICFVCLGIYILYDCLKQNNILFSDLKIGTIKYKKKKYI